MPWGEAFERKLSTQFKCPAYARPPPTPPPSGLTSIGALEHTENYRVLKLTQNCIFLNTGYDAYISSGKTSFTVRFEVINLSCNPKITQENRLYWKFLQTCDWTHLYPGCQRFFFSLGATELSGEAAKASREAARKKPLAPTDNNLTSMPTPVSFD